MAGAQTLVQPSRSKADFQLIDCDTHPTLPTGDLGRDLRPYLSRGWAERLEGESTPGLPSGFFYTPTGGFLRRELIDERGRAATDPGVSAATLFEELKVDRAVMIVADAINLGQMPDPHPATTVAGAINDYFIDRWVGQDSRWRACITIAPQDIGWSMAEIERLQGVPGVVAIYVPLNSSMLGSKLFYPVYEAAQEYKLPIVTHITLSGVYSTGMTIGAGPSVNYLDYRACQVYPHISQISNLVCHGIFETFPKLKFLFAEIGFPWLVDLMWRIDQFWRGLRDQTPFLRRPPSEYLLDHIRVATQPWPEPGNPEHVGAMLEMIEADRTLLFATDYPHWDSDVPSRIAQQIPEHMRRRVMVENAVELFGDRLI